MTKFHVICSDCEHKYYTDKDPIKDSDKMQCGKCGKRNIVLFKEWEKNHDEFFADPAQKLRQILQLAEVSQKKIDFVIGGYTMTPDMTRNDLFSLMTATNMNGRIAEAACKMFFGYVSREQQTLQSGSLAPQQQQQQQTPQPPVIILDRHGQPTTINPQQQVQGASPQAPIIFMPPQQQQQQTQGNRIIHRPMLRDNKVVRDENNAPIMETIIPPNMQQQESPVDKLLGSLHKFGVIGGKGTDNVADIQKSVEQGFEKISKGGEKDKIDRLIDVIENKFGQPPAQNPEIAELKAKLDIVTEKLYDTKTENKISAIKAEFENKFKSLEQQQAATKLTDPQFQMQSQEKSLGHVTDFAEKSGNIFAEKLAEVLVPMLEMQRTQMNAQMYTNLQAQEIQSNLPPGTLTAALMSPSKTQTTKPGDLTNTMKKIKERVV